MEVKPHEKIVVKVDGSRRLTLRNRRFVRELDPRKTSLEDHQPTTSNAVTPPTWTPPSPSMTTPPQIISSVPVQPGQTRF